MANISQRLRLVTLSSKLDAIQILEAHVDSSNSIFPNVCFTKIDLT